MNSLPEIDDLLDRYEPMRKALDELHDMLYPEIIALSILEARLGEYKEQLKALAFPRYIKFGFASFAYFALVGVIVPLATAASLEEVSPCTAAPIFLLFLSGLTCVLLYLYLEIRDAIGQKSETPARKKEQAEKPIGRGLSSDGSSL